MFESDQSSRPPIRWNPLAWLLIFLSGILILWVVPLLTPPEYAEVEDEASTLAIFKIQSRLIVGLEQLQPGAAETEAEDLDTWATSPQTTAAVAGLKFFRDPDGDGATQGIALIEKQLAIAEPSPSPEARQLLQDLQGLISGELEADVLDSYEITPFYFDYYRLAKMPPEAPERVAFLKEALMTAIGYVAGIAIVLGLAFVGLILLLLALVKQSSQNALTRFQERLDRDGYLLTGFALYLFIMAMGQVLSIVVGKFAVIDAFPTEIAMLFANGFAVAGMTISVLVGFFWATWRGMSFREMRDRLGWHRGKGFLREAGAGVVGYIAMLPIFLIGVVLTVLLGLALGHFAPDDAAAQPVSHPIVSQLAEGGLGLKIFIFILAAVLAPLFEETMFRGALYRAFRGKWNFLIAGLVSGFIFAVIHPQGIVAVPALTAMGFGFAMIREWRDSLIAPMVAHGVHNGALVIAMLLAFG